MLDAFKTLTAVPLTWQDVTSTFVVCSWINVLVYIILNRPSKRKLAPTRVWFPS